MTGAKPTLRYAEGSTVVPGDRLGTIRQVRPGGGCYVRQGHVYATLVGTLLVTEEDEEQDQKYQQQQNHSTKTDVSKTKTPPPPPFVCTVVPTTSTGQQRQQQRRLPASKYVLRVNQLVLGEVVRITPQNAIVDIRIAEGVGPLGRNCAVEGAIRMEDIRALASEAVVVADCFQPGDLVAARVISLGDSRRYFLSTAETELGVIRATSSNCNPSMNVIGSGSLKRRTKEDRVLVPISWKEMEDPSTGQREPRKVAKPLVLRTGPSSSS